MVNRPYKLANIFKKQDEHKNNTIMMLMLAEGKQYDITKEHCPS